MPLEVAIIWLIYIARFVLSLKVFYKTFPERLSCMMFWDAGPALILLQTVGRFGKVQNMDQGIMDPLHGPGRVHGPPIMDRVHGPPIFATKNK